MGRDGPKYGMTRMAVLPDYCALLRSAEAAIEAYYNGTSVVEFEDQNGERVKYNNLNIAALEGRAERLRRLCDPCYGRLARTRPIGFLFP